jgi:hypothetical protein
MTASTWGKRLLALVAPALLATAAAGSDETGQAVVISSGKLYLYGHSIQAPFTLTIDEATVSVNGVQVYPRLHMRLISPSEVSENARRRHQVTHRLFALQAELERAGRSTDEITPRLTELLRVETALVDSVTGVSDDAFWVWWRGERQPEQFLLRAPRDSTEPQERVEEERDLLRHALERDCLVIIAPSRQLIFPPDPPERITEVLAEIDRAREAAAGELTPERWPGRHLDDDLARLFQDPLTLPLEE